MLFLPATNEGRMKLMLAGGLSNGFAGSDLGQDLEFELTIELATVFESHRVASFAAMEA
jgi:hypothetical protein